MAEVANQKSRCPLGADSGRTARLKTLIQGDKSILWMVLNHEIDTSN